MFEERVKHSLHEELQGVRNVLVWKLEGLAEYDVRRPMTATGTNLLGLVKHVATWEARYLGEVFDRPFPEPLQRWQDSDGSDLWVTEAETREQILGLYQRVGQHADATIRALPLDAPGHVPWWPRPQVALFDVMVHVLNDSTRHAGHADILREQLDGQTGFIAGQPDEVDTRARAIHCATIEKVAIAASSTRGTASIR